MRKNFLAQINQSFDVVYLNEKNFPYVTFQRQNFSKIITIDNYQNENNDYFSFCFDRSIFLIEVTNLSIIRKFIMNYSDSLYYFISDIIIDYFKINNINANFNFSSKFNAEISNFIEEFGEFNIKLVNFIKCIAGYLILKSYKDSNKNRINHLIKNIEIRIPQHNELLKQFITIDQMCSSTSLVKLSYNIEDGKLYIIKIHTDYKEKDKLAKREYNNYQKLKHPFLPKLIEYYSNDKKDYRYLVIEYIDGVTLYDFDVNNLNEYEIYNIIFEIMITIYYIHSKNYVLRDLKPDNIKIDKNNTAILIDFDRIIEINDDVDSELTYNFNHEYISPEISNGAIFTNKTDIYSFGLLVKKMFVERYHKFSNKCLTKIDVMCKYCMKENPDDRPTISELIRFFYLNILSKNDSKSEVEKELIKILQYNFENQNVVDHEILCILGIIYQEGKYINMDIDEAIKYHSLAAEQNNLLSLYNLYSLFISYASNTNNIDIAIKCLKIGADLGDPFFQYKFGFNCFILNTSIDTNVCVEYLKRSASTNFTFANFTLGFIFYQSPKIKSIEEAIKYLTNATKYQKHNPPENNDFFDFHGTISIPNKQFIFDYKLNCGLIARFCSNLLLGDIYRTKNIDQYDISKSIYYYSSISKQDIIELQNIIEKKIDKYIPKQLIYITKSTLNEMIQNYAQSIFFLAHFNNIYDIDKCIEDLKFMLDLGNYMIPLYLGEIYSTNKFNRINISKAMEYYSIAEKKIDFIINHWSDVFLLNDQFFSNNFKQMIKKDSDAINKIRCSILNNFGNIYISGQFIQQDINKSINFFIKSSEYGDSVAQYMLGRIYYDGKYVKENIKKSIHYLTLSVKSKNKYSQYFLGKIYYKGEKVPKEIEKAIKYLKEAAENSIQRARFYLGIIYITEIDVKRNIKLSINYFKEAGNLNDSYAKNNLGIIYKNEEEIKPNITQSIEYFEEAIRFDNNEAARYNLAHIYFYCDQIKNQINKTIELLTKPELISIDYGHQLLCLALIKECKSLSVKNIKDILVKVYPKCDKSIALDIYNEIKANNLLNENKYNELFEQIETIELFYLDHKIIIQTNDLNIIKPVSTNIDIDFYKGFDNDELVSKYQMENPNSIKRKKNIKPIKNFIKPEHLTNQMRNINIKAIQIKNNSQSMNDNSNSNIKEENLSKIFKKYEEDVYTKKSKK